MAPIRSARLIATIAGSTTVYHHPDHLSVRATSDSSGNKVGEQGHFPFGEAWYAANTTTKWQFTSYERDAESGNDYAMARHYNSRLGRFMSPDSLAGNTSNPQSLNRYAYALNSPTNLVDPTGRDTCPNSSSLVKQAVVGAGLGDGFAMWLEEDDGCNDGCSWDWENATITCPGGSAGDTSGADNGNLSDPWQPPPPGGCVEIFVDGADMGNSCGQQLPPVLQGGLPGGGSGGRGAAGFGSSLDTPPKEPTSNCVLTGHVTGVGPGQATGSGALGFVPPAGSVAIDPLALGLFPGAQTNSLLAPRASEITFSFSPALNLPSGFPTTHTLGDILDPKARVGGIYFHGLYGFDIYRFASGSAANAVTEKARVTITFPSSLPLNCGGPIADPILPPPGIS